MDERQHSTPKALFLGAHADDIEIGAGGTVAKLCSVGYEIWLCILTADQKDNVAAQRKIEAILAAKEMGVDSGRVLFLGLPDTQLECNSEAIDRLRATLKNRDIDPDMVFTHANADSHNDHRAVHDITLAPFRRKPILLYSVVNSAHESVHLPGDRGFQFSPRIFVDISAYAA